MNNIEKYVLRQTFLPPIFTDQVTENVGLVVTLPAYAEPDLIGALESLKACVLPSCPVEVIVIVNHPETATTEQRALNLSVSEEAKNWADLHSTDHLRFLISDPIEFPKKHAGAGLARKVAMDEATVRLQQSQVENPIIICFDADAACSSNYLQEIEQHFKKFPKSLGCSLNFEHPLTESPTDFLNEGIMQYELHLRYYQAALVYANHPQAEFTVGSSMAVTRNAYVAQGGMNRRKAGEDFWFMLKLMMAGEITAITEATVYPSSRESFRVPFGTGRAMSEMTEKKDNTFCTAAFSSFERLKVFLTSVDDLYLGPVDIGDALTLQFLEKEDWISVLDEIRAYTTDVASFKKRFYRWFNVFMVMKFFHYLRDEAEADVAVLDASNDLAIPLGVAFPFASTTDALLFFRAKKRVQSTDYTLH